MVSPEKRREQLRAGRIAFRKRNPSYSRDWMRERRKLFVKPSWWGVYREVQREELVRR